MCMENVNGDYCTITFDKAKGKFRYREIDDYGDFTITACDTTFGTYREAYAYATENGFRE